jgi:hypothetical protein
MGRQGDPRALDRGPIMRCDELVALGVKLDGATAPADPHLLADQSKGRRIVRLLKGDVAIPMDLQLCPRREVVRMARQRLKRGVLDRPKARQRWVTGCPVDPHAGGLLDPLPQFPIEVIVWLGIASRQEVALDVVDAALLDLPFQPGGDRWIRIDPKAIMVGALAIAPLGQRLVDAGMHDRALEVVQDNPLRHAAQKVERVPMTQQSGFQALIKHDLGIQMPAPGEDQDKQPRFARASVPWIEHPAGKAKVDLRLAAGFGFHPHHRVGLLGLEVLDHAPDRAVADRPLVAFFQPRPNRRDLHPPAAVRR